MLTTGLAWTTSEGCGAAIAAALTAGIGAGVGARTGFGRTGPPHVEQYLYSSGFDAPHVVHTPFALAFAAADAAVGTTDAAGAAGIWACGAATAAAGGAATGCGAIGGGGIGVSGAPDPIPRGSADGTASGTAIALNVAGGPNENAGASGRERRWLESSFARSDVGATDGAADGVGLRPIPGVVGPARELPISGATLGGVCASGAGAA